MCPGSHKHTATRLCPYMPLKQFSPSPANLIKTLLLSSDGFWIFIYFVDFGFCLFYYIPHVLKGISPKFRHSTSFPWFQLTLYPLGQWFQTGNVERHSLVGTRSGQGRGTGWGCVCVLSTSWGYRLGILLINILQCTRQLLTTKNCLVQNINGTETLLLAYNSNWLLIFSHVVELQACCFFYLF